MTRRCLSCGRAITECMGAVLPRDICRALAGEIPLTAIRELCGLCVMTFDISTLDPEIAASPLLSGLVSGEIAP
jgi:hypothetical protein